MTTDQLRALLLKMLADAHQSVEDWAEYAKDGMMDESDERHRERAIAQWELLMAIDGIQAYQDEYKPRVLFLGPPKRELTDEEREDNREAAHERAHFRANERI